MLLLVKTIVILAILILFSVFSVTTFADDISVEDEYGVMPFFTYASACDSKLTLNFINAKMTVEGVSVVYRLTVNGDLLKYTSDGWSSVYTFSKTLNSNRYTELSYSRLISATADYCLKTVVVFYISAHAETATLYRYS